MLPGSAFHLIHTHAACQAESYPFFFLLKAEGCSLLLAVRYTPAQGPLSEGAALWLVLTSSVAGKQSNHHPDNSVPSD